MPMPDPLNRPKQPFVALGPSVYVDPGPNQMRWTICRVDPNVDPDPAAAARLIAEALNAYGPARMAVL
jgi:hypothetical protein